MYNMCVCVRACVCVCGKNQNIKLAESYIGIVYRHSLQAQYALDDIAGLECLPHLGLVYWHSLQAQHALDDISGMDCLAPCISEAGGHKLCGFSRHAGRMCVLILICFYG